MKVKVKLLSRVRLFATPWTVAHQAPPSVGFFRQEYWSGLPFPSPGDLPNPGIEPESPALEAEALSSEPPGKPMNMMLAVAYSCIAFIIKEMSFYPCFVKCFYHKSILKVKVKSLSHVQLFATPWTIQSMEFSRSGY